MDKKGRNSIISHAISPDSSEAQRSLDRREFLGLAALSSAALALTPQSSQAATAQTIGPSNSTSPAFAAFHSLAPGQVRPDGWLQLYLQKQAQQLATHLPEVCWPFSGAYWSGEENRPDPKLASGQWWPW